MRVKYNNEWSDEHMLNGGSPQGALLSIIIFCIYTIGVGMKMPLNISNEPNDYPIMPMEQEIRQDNTIRLKYVDDTTLAVKLQLDKLFELKEAMETGTSIPEYFFEEKAPRELTEFQMSSDRNTLHEMIDDVAKFVHLNQMKINTKKSKTMLFNDSQVDGYLKYSIEGHELEMTEEMKVIGFLLQSNSKVSSQVDYMLKRAMPRVFSLKKLMMNGASRSEGLTFYTLWVRSIFEFQVSVWNGRLTKWQVKEIEKVQKRCLLTILGRKSYRTYDEALKTLDLKTLSERREDLCFNFVKKAKKNHPNLYPVRENTSNTRLSRYRPLQVPKHSSELHKRSGKVYLTELYNSRIELLDPISTIESPPKNLLDKHRRHRCGKCENCKKPNCGSCAHCSDMKMFGGKGKLKQACKERKCIGMFPSPMPTIVEENCNSTEQC